MKFANRSSISIHGVCLMLAVALMTLQSHAATSTWRAIADSRTNNAVHMLNDLVGWSVGDQGAIDATIDGGVTWTPQTSGVSSNLLGVYAADSTNVWAVGQAGTILKFNGTAWTKQTSGAVVDLHSVTGISTSAVWAVGSSGTILKWNGTAWSAQLAPPGNTGNSFFGIYVQNANSAWAVGDTGTIIAWNGSAWSTHTSGVTSTLNAVWGNPGTSELFAVGATGVILHNTFASTTWTTMTSGTGSNLTSVSGRDASHVWAVGSGGTIQAYDGTTWAAQGNTAGTPNLNGVSAGVNGAATTVVATGVLKTYAVFSGLNPWTSQAAISYNAVWMATALNGWAVGDAGGIFRTTDGGDTWVSQVSGTAVNLRGVWGSDTSNIWAVGAGGVILKYDGTNWAAQTSGVTSALQAVMGNSATSVWAVGATGALLYWDGTTWASQNAPTGTTGTQFNGVWVVDAFNVWAVGGANTIIKFNGTNWVKQITPSYTPTAPDWRGIWAANATDLLVVGTAGNIVRSTDGFSWSVLASGTGAQLNAISGTASNRVFAAGNGGVLRYFDGISWVAQNTNPGATGNLNGIAAVNAGLATTVVAVGAASTVYGSPWIVTSSDTPTNSYTAAWGPDDDKVWFVGSGGRIQRWNGKTWSLPIASPTTANLTAIWGVDESNVWAVGSGGAIIRWNGSAWATQNSSTSANLNSVFGTSTTNVWAVGTGGTIVRWDGSAWAVQVSGVANALNGVWAADKDHALAVGNGGVSLKWDGIAWSKASTPNSSNLTGIWGADINSVYAVGDSGSVIKYGNSFWQSQAYRLATDNLSGIAVPNSKSQWAVGGSTILRGNGSNVWVADGSIPVAGVSAALTGAFATSPSAVFLTAANGMVFVNSPITVSEIGVELQLPPAPNVPLLSNISPIDFGLVNAPNISAKTFTLKNSGTGTLTGLAITKDGAGAADYTVSALPGTTLAAGQATTFTVTFLPKADGVRSAAIRIASSDVDEVPFIINVTGTGRLAPKVTVQPLSKTVNPNTRVVFSVAATGTSPITYQWYRGLPPAVGAPIATGTSMTIVSAQEGDQDTYFVKLDNPATDTGAPNPAPSTYSNVVTLSVNDPISAVTPPASQIVEAGKPASFTVTVGGGTGPFTYTWRKNGIAVAAAVTTLSTSNTFTIPSTLVTQAGNYSVSIKNIVGTVISPAAPSLGAELNVVDTTVKPLILLAGTTATMPVSMGFDVNSYTWLKGGMAPPADPRITGLGTKTLSIKTLVSGDSGLYTCAGNFPITPTMFVNSFKLTVYTDAPEFVTTSAVAGKFVLPAATVGQVYAGYQIPVNTDPLKTPATFTVSPALPKGLILDPITGAISGIPDVLLTAPKTYELTFTLNNAKGHPTFKGTLVVNPFDQRAVGAFTGPLSRSPALMNGNLGGKFDLTTTSARAYSGKVTFGALGVGITGSLVVDAIGTGIHGSSTFKRPAAGVVPETVCTVTFDIDAATHKLVNAQVTDGTNTLAFEAWRKKWGTFGLTTPESDDLKTYLGYYTFGLDVPPPTAPIPSDDPIPQGMSFGSFTVAPTTGLLTAVGTMADGTTFTTSTFCGPRGEVLIFQAPSATLASVVGFLKIKQGTAMAVPPYSDNSFDNTVLGSVSWMRPASTLTTAHTYKAGFGPVPLSQLGARYVVPTGTTTVLGNTDDLTITPNATLAFTDGGITGTAVDPLGTFTKPNIDVHIKANGSVLLPTSNPDLTKLTIVNSTGKISGTFNLLDTNPAGVPATIPRPVSYSGIIVRDNGVLMGEGFFLLNRRPVPTVSPNPVQKLADTDKLSGMVKLTKKP